MVIRCAMSSLGWGPRALGQTCPPSGPHEWRALATHLPQDNRQEGRREAIGHRVGLGGRAQCAAWDPPICPSILTPPHADRTRAPHCLHCHGRSRPPTRALPRTRSQGFLVDKFEYSLSTSPYRKHERRTISGPLGPHARGLRERAHAGGQRPCAADARAPGAVACVCTMSRRAEGRPCRGLIRTP